MSFGKEDMEQKHYRWIEDQKAHPYSGDPTRRPFDRYNGDQVLFIINYCESLFDQFTPQEGRKLEQHITNFLPLDVKSEISVVTWLRNQMKSKMSH
jgi:hypothetical protein